MGITNNLGQTRVGIRNLVQVPQTIVSGNLVLNLDASNLSSYTGTGTTWYDLSGNNLNGTLANGPIFRPLDGGGSFQFDGINDAVAINYSSKYDIATPYRDLPMSFNGWVKFNTTGGGTFINNGDNGNAYAENYTITITSTGLQFQLIQDTSSWKSVTIKSNTTLIPGVWYNYAITYTGGFGDFGGTYQTYYNGTTKIYINGVEQSTTITNNSGYAKLNANVTTSTKLFIGSFGQVGAPGSYWAGSFNGYVATTLIYNRVLTSGEVSQNYNATKSRFTIDTDAQVFINMAGLTSSTQANAINTLVTSLKSAGIWTKMKAIYPFIGGTAESHKWNLKDPRDLDAAFRLVFNGGWVHSSTGALPNGTTGYADTKLNTNILSTTNTSFSLYLRTTSRPAGSLYPVDLGAFTSDYSGRYGLSYISSDGNSYFDIYNRNTVNNTNFGTGFVQYSRTSSTLAKVFYKNTLVDTNTSGTNSYSNPNNTIYLGALHLGSGLDSYSNCEQAFTSIGDGLTDTEATNLYTIVQTYQTSLGRQV